MTALFPLLPRRIWRIGLFALLLSAHVTAGTASAAPEHAVLLSGLSDGRRIEVCGQLVEAPSVAQARITPLRQLFSGGEAGHGRIELRLQDRPGVALAMPVKAGRGGAFCVRARLETLLSPATYRIRWLDARGQPRSGEAHLRVIDPLDPGPIVTSDIDQTYLYTNFHSAGGVRKLLTATGNERRSLEGMAELYRGLRGEENRVPLRFLSGSPTFFRPVLETRMSLDGFTHDGMMLKSYGEIASAQLKRGGPIGLVAALKHQVAYKLGRLLEQRLQLPVRAREILLGDDVEADAIVYSLYREVVGEGLAVEALEARLHLLGVPKERADLVCQQAKRVREKLGDTLPRVEPYIRRWSEGEPDPRLKVSWHRDSYQLALALYQAGDLDAQAVQRVGALLGEGEAGDAARARSAGWALERGLVLPDRFALLHTETKTSEL